MVNPPDAILGIAIGEITRRPSRYGESRPRAGTCEKSARSYSNINMLPAVAIDGRLIVVPLPSQVSAFL